MSLNYTSGTTGDPKGVVYHHRGRPSWPSPTWSRAGSAGTRSISGPCRCSTATAGASPGPCPSWPAPMSA
ncbi:AMP-binding protein [Methylobacterium persicinum]